MKLILALLALMTTLVLNAIPAFADGDDDMIQVGAGAKFDKDGTSVLLKLSYGGFANGEFKYLIVKSQVVLGVGEGNKSGDESGIVRELELSVVPISKDMEGAIEGRFRILPFAVKREVDLGINGAVSIEAVGWSVGTDGDATALETKKLSWIGEMALDVAGVTVARLPEDQLFSGVSIGHAELEGGFQYKFSNDRAIAVVGELESGISFGTIDGRTGALTMAEAGLEVDYLFKLLGQHFTAFVRGEYELVNRGNDPMIDEFKFKIGISKKF